jgi:two-component system NarL family response regulator/two-component system response regulator DevR
MPPDADRPAHVRVVLVDADDRVRESLCGLLCIGDRLEVVGSTGQTVAALDLVIETHPDIVVIDPRLPELDGGLSFIGRLRAIAPDVRVLVMSGIDPAEQADLVAAADGFVRKTFRPSDLVAAVVAAALPLAG